MRSVFITAIILTYNEEANLGRCLKSVAGLADKIIIVDSLSTDRTVEIARQCNAEVFERKFKNQSEQFSWALDNVPITTEWVLRLDADEYITPELREEITETLSSAPPEIGGYYIKRRVYFLGRWIKHGGYYPTWLLRLWRKGVVRIEDREMDEHAVLLKGRAAKLKHDFVDDNRKGLEEWTAKHNNYSTREARARMKESEEANGESKTEHRFQTQTKKWIKNNIYAKIPLLLRPFLYFLYRYGVRLGFLDGKEGLVFHFLQGCWHQFLVDAKMYEKQKKDIVR